MVKYGGELIYRRVDEYGPIEVVDVQGVRSLHFGSPARQSAMDLAEPDRIEMPYLRSMLAALFFVPSPCRILVLGLGGGTLGRFFLQQFPQAEIHLVELRAGVLAVARSHFHFVLQPPLKVHVQDAFDFLLMHKASGQAPIDFLCVDIFDAEGPSTLMESPDFLSHLAHALSPKGIVVINLWTGESGSLRKIQGALLDAFSGAIAALPVPGRGNRVYLVLGKECKIPPMKAGKEMARGLEFRYGIEFPRFLDRFEWIRSEGARS